MAMGRGLRLGSGRHTPPLVVGMTRHVVQAPHCRAAAAGVAVPQGRAEAGLMNAVKAVGKVKLQVKVEVEAKAAPGVAIDVTVAVAAAVAVAVAVAVAAVAAVAVGVAAALEVATLLVLHTADVASCHSNHARVLLRRCGSVRCHVGWARAGMREAPPPCRVLEPRTAFHTRLHQRLAGHVYRRQLSMTVSVVVVVSVVVACLHHRWVVAVVAVAVGCGIEWARAVHTRCSARHTPW